ncbi:MAG: M15 family metallopeptidase [Helicobacteraceae bacterium]|nr:M15 family metallopeptidase [Helicobacteraceae bacterium]
MGAACAALVSLGGCGQKEIINSNVISPPQTEEELVENDEMVLEEAIGSDARDVKDHLDVDLPPSDLAPVIAKENEFDLLKALQGRLHRLMKYIGFGNFNIINFDQMRSIAASVSAIGAFPRSELDYFEELFFRDAKEYGFLGEKVSLNMTDSIKTKEVFKVPQTGHYLFKGQAMKVYEDVKKDIGSTIFLTSGVRGVPKQMHLFLAKTLECKGDYSEASHSLAPAGYSYHGIGDFDVGKIGFGERNFTQDFAQTKEYEKLMQLGYIMIRYPRGNPYGVYFEPWHIEVV